MKALRTLIVEDDAMIGGLLAETLEGLGHGVSAVENNVDNAVAAASRCRPDLMIVDVGLGEASGIAAVNEILRSGFVDQVVDQTLGQLPAEMVSTSVHHPDRIDELLGN